MAHMELIILQEEEFGFTDDYASGCNGLLLYNNGYKSISSPNRYTVDKIYSLSGSYNEKEMVFYENGTKYSMALSGTLHYNSNTIYVLSGNPSGTSCGGFTKEKIYSVRIYNRALTDEEVLINYNIDKERFHFSD